MNGPVPPVPPQTKEPPRTMFGSGNSTVFSLSREKELVKSQDRRGKARGRGRVNPSIEKPAGGGPVGMGRAQQRSTRQTRYLPPKTGSGGITVIEPMEKESESAEKQEEAGQFEDIPSPIQPQESANEQPGLPLRGSGVVGGASSSEGKDLTADGEEVGKGEEIPAAIQVQQGEGSQQQRREEGSPGGVAQVAASKPKRYSSQRQLKSGGQSADMQPGT